MKPDPASISSSGGLPEQSTHPHTPIASPTRNPTTAHWTGKTTNNGEPLQHTWQVLQQ